ncbi:MAG: hypothetical protein V3R73_06200 [Sphingomonadales bacterium]
MSSELKIKWLIGISLVAVLVTIKFVPEWPQDQDYHEFAGDIPRLGIPNFANVASNLAYLIPGLMGLHLVSARLLDGATFIGPREALPFYVVFAGAVVLAFGSGFYHLAPDNLTLVADRLTMTIGFMGVLSFIIAERIDVDWGLKLLPGLLAIGLFSVIYWIFPEIRDPASVGDLRFYGLVQYLPLALIPIILLAFPARYSGAKYIWWTLGCYLVAKGFEKYDDEVWGLLEPLSGHALKHLISGLGIYFLLLYVQKRRALKVS